MQILEDHNKQLESQLQLLRELLLQPNADDGKTSSISENKCPTDDKRGTPDTEAADDVDRGTRDVSLHLEDIMEKLNNAFPSTRDKELCDADSENHESPTLNS
ncbi:dystrophin-related protein 2-like [Eleutherodactylus coqui]|uniref:dystrophin-related protein 2-like n=1 Tax=Eleutherodactylus coqui TaxID=57060 RepID=UPI0034631104